MAHNLTYIIPILGSTATLVQFSYNVFDSNYQLLSAFQDEGRFLENLNQLLKKEGICFYGKGLNEYFLFYYLPLS